MYVWGVSPEELHGRVRLMYMHGYTAMAGSIAEALGGKALQALLEKMPEVFSAPVKVCR